MSSGSSSTSRRMIFTVSHVDDGLAGLRMAIGAFSVRHSCSRRNRWGRCRACREVRLLHVPRMPMWPLQSANVDSALELRGQALPAKLLWEPITVPFSLPPIMSVPPADRRDRRRRCRRLFWRRLLLGGVFGRVGLLTPTTIRSRRPAGPHPAWRLEHCRRQMDARPIPRHTRGKSGRVYPRSLMFDGDTVGTGLHVVGQVGRFSTRSPLADGDDPDGQTVPGRCRGSAPTGVRGHASSVIAPGPVGSRSRQRSRRRCRVRRLRQFDPAGGRRVCRRAGAAVDVIGVVLFSEWRCVRSRRRGNSSVRFRHASGRRRC